METFAARLLVNARDSLPGPSRTITVEPVEVPTQPPEPTPELPAEAPDEAPAREPAVEPVPAQ